MALMPAFTWKGIPVLMLATMMNGLRSFPAVLPGSYLFPVG
jgi:hypothetical protein